MICRRSWRRFLRTVLLQALRWMLAAKNTQDRVVPMRPWSSDFTSATQLQSSKWLSSTWLIWRALRDLTNSVLSEVMHMTLCSSFKKEENLELLTRALWSIMDLLSCTQWLLQQQKPTRKVRSSNWAHLWRHLTYCTFRNWLTAHASWTWSFVCLKLLKTGGRLGFRCSMAPTCLSWRYQYQRRSPSTTKLH